MRTVYGIPPELQYNKVLFVEKRGLNTMLNESGTLDRFNTGVVGTQGYAPRAAKKLMEYLINSGISVYILHDCDLFGYNIHERIAEGSDTYPVSYTHLRAHEPPEHLVCRLLLEKKKHK